MHARAHTHTHINKTKHTVLLAYRSILILPKGWLTCMKNKTECQLGKRNYPSILVQYFEDVPTELIKLGQNEHIVIMYALSMPDLQILNLSSIK